MTKDVTCAPARMDLVSAAGLMRQHDCGSLPVTDAGGRVSAMVTDRDICLALAEHERPPREIAVGEIAGRTLVTASETDEVHEAVRVMGDHQVRRLPVLDQDGRLCGVLSLADLALNGAVEPAVLAGTLTHIAEAHRAH
ncbi:MAG: CBS domain-containing protein [Vicinamibacterales bacterium]